MGATLLYAVVGVVPALIAAPGRMTADSKLYLYLDPGRLIGDALGSYDPRQFAGWVPHQHISFVWPSGPWYWLSEQVGAPDWIAHRLWLGGLLVLAALGVRWCALQLGLATLPALVAGIAYELAPYILPYVSRTSVMLLPWAGLGWIVALTIRATRRPGWRDPALIALVVLTVGAVNATALAMIVPAPALWLVHAVWGRWCTWRAAAVVAVRTAVLSIGVSLWWIVALVVQGRHGAEVLSYSESLADVSFTATSAEVWRGLGYWLFYVRDPYAATTTASLRYLDSPVAITVGFLVPIIALGALVWVRWAHRRFALLLVAAGVVLAVGVYPIDDRSPLMRILTGDGESGLALALRSSTRALPVMNLGLALALGSLVAGVAHVRWRAWWGDHLVAIGVIVVVLANVPAIWGGAFVDPALERDQHPPPSWIEAAATLDATGDGRVLMLPGTEFGAYRWGYTVDQPLPGLTDRSLVTRDLLPLGSPAAMDLWFAFDDRIQDGVPETASLPTLARLFGADVVWLTNDLAFDRFGLARPEVVREMVFDSPSVIAVEAFGEPTVNVPDFAIVDPATFGEPAVGTAVAPVELAFLDTSGDLARAYDRTLLVAGSGDGLVDLGAVDLLPAGVGVRYAADDPNDWPSDVGVVVTDSNRDQARHWRSSQDTRGLTETGGSALGVLDELASDARLPVFDGIEPEQQTTARQRGPVTAIASAYGEPFAYTPERRAVMAIDGDPTTAWIVGEHGDPIGERLRLTFPGGSPDGELRLLQPVAPEDRRISRIAVVEGAGRLDDETRRELTIGVTDDGWSAPIVVAPDTTVVEIEIIGVEGGTPFTDSIVAGVGFAEVDLGLEPTVEVVVPPEVPGSADPATPVGWVFTRWRTDPLDPWRSDPEPTLIREIATPVARDLAVSPTVRIDARAPDADLAAAFGWPVVASTRLVGSLRHAGVAAFDGDLTTTWMSDFGDGLGARLVVDDVAEAVERIVLTQPIDDISLITEVEVSGGGVSARLPVIGDDNGTAILELARPIPAGQVTVEVTAIEPVVTRDRRFGDPFVTPVAIGELQIEGGPGVAPLDDLRWNSDCTTIATIGEAPLRASLSIGGPGWLDGEPIGAVPCTDPVEIESGEHLIVGADGLFQLDRLVLDDGVRPAVERPGAAPRVTERDAHRYGGSYTVSGCEQGCWFVFGAGYNEAWTVEIDGVDGGEPALLDGGFNGWWIHPSEGEVSVEVRWSAQGPLTIALLATIGFVVVCLVVIVRRRRDRVEPPRAIVAMRGRAGALSRTGAVAGAVVWTTSSLLLIGPWGALWGAIGGVGLLLTRSRLLPALVGVATVAGVGGHVAIVQGIESFPADAGWPDRFSSMHSFGMFAVACLVTTAVLADDATDGYRGRYDEPDAGEPDADEPGAEPSAATTAALPSDS